MYGRQTDDQTNDNKGRPIITTAQHGDNNTVE